MLIVILTMLTVLDPRISYEGLKMDYAADGDLNEHLEKSKTDLFVYFQTNYAGKAIPRLQPSTSESSTTPPTTHSTPKKSFTARYRRKEKPAVNELDEYFKLLSEDFEMCDPIQWWVGRRAQFPNLFRLACDIICIPGK